MFQPAYQLNKVRRLIRTGKQRFTFYRFTNDEYGEPNLKFPVKTLPGLYHESAGIIHIGDISADSSTTIQKILPMILALWEDAKEIAHDDYIDYNGITYRVTAVKDIGEAQIIAEISLEDTTKRTLDDRIQS